ncbi:MAG: Ig-like domain-containing protein [Vibrio sp.]|uniref:Ig-like domain-containing protein n=1 Tax=Vibrio sp. TaxID=678 RepID=UPI003A873A1A
MKKIINVVSRKTNDSVIHTSDKLTNMAIFISEPSVIQMRGTTADVAKYVRQGNELIIYFQDGTIVKLRNYFADSDSSSELVFESQGELTHVEFDSVNISSHDLTPVELVAHQSNIESIAPFFDDSSFLDYAFGITAGLFAGIGGYMLNDGKSESVEVAAPQIETVSNPTFVVLDDSAEQTWGITHGAVTHDTTPQFSGTGHPGATIQVKDANGNTIASVIVGSDGTWSVTLSAQEYDTHTWSILQINGNDVAHAGEISFTIAPEVASISVDIISADSTINYSELLEGITLSGQTEGLQVGTELTVVCNGNTYIATVSSDGSWSTLVPTNDSQLMSDGEYTVTVTGQDKAGNEIVGSYDLTVDTLKPEVTIDPVTGDNILNALELNQVQIVSGTATGVPAGTKVLVKIGDAQYTALVDASGQWSVALSSIASITTVNGKFNIEVTVVDVAGNVGKDVQEVLIDTDASLLEINTIAEDNILNAIEKGETLSISGSSGGFAAGTIVTVTLNHRDYEATIASDGSWSVDVSPADLALLGNSSYLVSVSATNEAGNITEEQASLTVDTSLPTVVIDTIASNDIVNAAEIVTGQTITGSVSNAKTGDTVVILLGGVRYTATVQDDLTWSLDLSSDVFTALGDGEITINASVTNERGNTGSVDHDMVVDAKLPGLRVDTIAGDDVLNSIETGHDLVISGTSTHLEAGSSITIHVNGKDYAATILANGRWQTGISAADVSEWPEGCVDITVDGLSGADTAVSIIYPVTVDLDALAISIDPITDDNVINALEKGQELPLSGMTSNVEAGQVVTIILAGQRYTAEVDGDGRWSVNIPAEQVAMLKDGDHSVQVSVSNVNGNSTSATHEFEVDTLAPTLVINTISSDDVLNAQEQGADLIISGSCNADAGQTVTVVLNGNEYTANVDNTGKWTLAVPAADLDSLTDGTVTVSATVADQSGNETSVDRDITVDTTAPVVTINTIAGDNVLNASEVRQAQFISGTATGVAEGTRVTVTINNLQVTTIVDESGNWSVGVPSSTLSTAPDGELTVEVTVIDSAGNSGSATSSITIDTEPSVIVIDTLAQDNVLNAIEKGEALIVSGSSDELVEGTVVTVTLNGQTYTAEIDANGLWTLAIAPADLASLVDTDYTLTATASDDVGNIANASVELLVDTTLPTVIINTIAGDNIINAAEVNAGQTIKGRVVDAQQGDTVTVVIGGNSYTAEVQADLSWSVNIPSDVLQALGDGSLTVTASVANEQGNIGSADLDVTIDAKLPGLRVDTIAGDDVINGIEHQQALVISGSSSGLTVGSNVTIKINGEQYAATVSEGGNWSVGIPAEVVSAWSDGALDVVVEGVSSAGNPVSINHPITVDLSPVAISVDTVAGDDVLNALEKGETLVISGTTLNVEEGQIVTIILGGKQHTASVQSDGSWSVSVAANDVAALNDGHHHIEVSVSNVNGNGASASHELSVDSSAPTLTINTIAADDILNAIEQANNLIINGTSSAEVGQTVTVTLNEHEYTATVGADKNWSVTVSADDLAALADGHFIVTATVTDKAGNAVEINRDLTVDTVAPVITINTVAGDDVINAEEQNQPLIVTGNVTGVLAGSRVEVDIDGTKFITITDADGNWSVGIPSSVVSAASGESLTITATVTGEAGNTHTVIKDVAVETAEHPLIIHDIAEDNILNAIEKGQALTISGESEGLSEGTVVTVELNGKSYTATTDASGAWSLEIQPVDLADLGDVSYTLTASATNDVGNASSSQTSLLVDTSLPMVVINSVAGNNVLNASDVAVGQTISGMVSNAAANDTVIVTLGGQTYTASVQSDLSWNINVPTEVLTALGNGELTINATVTNGRGNTGSAEHDITIDVNLPGLRVDTVSGDDVINSIEHGQALVITGSSSDIPVGSSVTVTINGKDYSGTVVAGGDWQIGISSADVSAWPAGEVSIVVSGESSAGNGVTITHPIVVDLSEVSVSIGTISDDNILNAMEKGNALTLSGETQNVEAGQTVTITLNGNKYTATVAEDGSWTVDIPADKVALLQDGKNQVTVSVSNVNGNSGSAEQEFVVDSVTPQLTINDVAVDNMLNAVEQGNALVIDGTSSAEAGQTVTITLNDKVYTGLVDNNGLWSVTVPAEDLALLNDGEVSISADVTDKAGNSSSAQHEFVVDTTSPTLTINVVAFDDVINAAESTQGGVIRGTAVGAKEGKLIKVTFAGQTYTSAVDEFGNWSIGVPASVVSQLEDGTFTIIASAIDDAGNSVSVSKDIEVNTASASMTINDIATDNVLNSIEKGEALTISGGSDGLSAGTTVTVNLNNKNYTATVENDGSWSVTIEPSDLAALGDVSYTVSVTATNDIGNSTLVESSLLVDTSLPVVTIYAIANDDIINASEIESVVVVAGHVANAKAGDTVTITLGGQTFTTTVADDLSWSVNVPSDVLKALGDGELTVKASVTNEHGNTGSHEHDITIDANLPSVRVNVVSGDDVINSIEAEQALIITGSSHGLAEGSTITVLINGQTYITNILADGSWQAPISAEDVALWADGHLDIQVIGESEAGNAVSITHPITVDLSDVAISVNAVTADNIVNAMEQGTDLTISGATRNVENGQTVTITLNGRTYTAIVQDGTWSVNVPSSEVVRLEDGNRYLQVNVTNQNGNGASATHEFDVDSVAPTLTINTIATDDIINATEQGKELVISGTSNAQMGQVVTITVNGQSYTGSVNSNGLWKVTVPAEDLATIADGNITVEASIEDVAGNSTSASREVTVDTTVPNVTINSVTDDNVINSIESKAGVAISGTSDAEVGSKVVVTFNDRNYETTIQSDGSWSIDVPSNHLSGLMQGEHGIQVSVTDSAGNSHSESTTVSVEVSPPTLTIDIFAQDNYVNSAEHELMQTITGTSDAIGQEVTVTLNGQTYTGIVGIDGTWSIAVSATDMQALAEGQNTITASVNGALGNNNTTEANFEVDLTAPTAVINVEAITDDTGIDTTTGVSEINSDFRTSDNQFTLSGSTTGTLAANDIFQVSLDGGVTWSDVTLINGNWSITNSSALLDGSYTYYFRVVDAAGNAGKVVSKTVTVDTENPEHTVTISGYEDNVGIYQSGELGLFASGDYTDDQSILLKGTLDKEISAQLGETGVIRIYNGTTLLGVATVDGLEWSFLVEDLAEGAHNLTAVVVDLVGNEGSYSQEFVINVDLTAPTITASIDSYVDNIDSATHDAAVTLANNSQTNDTLPLLQGSLSGAISATDTVRIYDSTGAFIGTAVVDGNSWSLQLTTPLTEGDHTFTVFVVDQAGNHSASSPDFTLTVDITPPAQTVTIDSYIDNVNNGDYQTGEHLSGSHTNDTTPELQGRLSSELLAGEVVRIYQNGNYIGDATVNADLTWSYLVDNELSDGRYDYTAVVADAVGNEGGWSNELNLTVDTVAPSEGSVTVDALTTADATPTITGTVQGMAEGNRLQVLVNGVLYTHGVDDELTVTGTSWSLKIPANHALNANGTVDIAYEVEARIADLAGNAKLDATSDELVVLRDTTVVRSPGFDYLAELQPELLIRGNPGENEKLVVTIKNAAGDTVATFDSSLGQMTQLSTGNWSISAANWGETLLSAGKYTAFSEVVVADGSGGQSMEQPIEFTIVEPVINSLASNHTDSRYDDSNAKVVANPDGESYWVFWAQSTSTSNTPTYNLMAEQYDSQGNLIAGSTITVATNTGQTNGTNLQYISLYDVYMKADSSFSVFYSQGSTTPYLANYTASGELISRNSVQSNQTYELTPSYVELDNGDYILVFVSGTVESYNVYSQRYSADGTALDANPIALTSGSNQANGMCYMTSTYIGRPTGMSNSGFCTQGMASVAVGDGKYAVLHMSEQSISGSTISNNGATGGLDMHLKIYDANTGSSTPVAMTLANSETAAMQIGADLVRLHDGSFVAIWASNHGSSGTYGTGDGFDVYSRRFKWDESTQSLVALDATENRVNTSQDGVNGISYNEMSVNFSATGLVQGGYVVTWAKATASNKSEIYAQTYDAAGNKVGGETLLSVNSPNVDSQPSVTALLDGGYVVSWNNQTNGGNYHGVTTNDIKTIIINPDGTIRGEGDDTIYSAASVTIAESNDATLAGSEGVNTLDGRGYSGVTLNGLAGNDYLMIDTLNFTSIAGGIGFDTLLWDSIADLDLAAVSDRVQGIEAIHLGDNNANKLTLTLESVQGASDTTDVLVVYGGDSDSLELTDSGWSLIGEQIWRGDIYQVYENNNSTEASLWVQDGITVYNSGASSLSVVTFSQGLLRGSDESDVIDITAEQQIIEMGNGGQDSLLFNVLNSADSLAGHSETLINGFTVGNYGVTMDADRIDISELLRTNTEFSRLAEEYANGDIDLSALKDFLSVEHDGTSTSIKIDRDGSGNSYELSTLVTLNGVQTDLESLLLNNQLVI